MELKDVAAMHIPSQPAPPAAAGFGDEYGEPARRYALRRPGKRPYLAAAVVSAFWLGGAAAFVAGYLGLDGLLALDWPWLAGLAFAVAFPIALTWFVALLARRSQGLQLASEDLLQIAARLIERDAAAGREIQRLGRAVRREIDALNTGLEGALIRVRTLESSIAERLASVEETARGLEERGDAIRTALREEREGHHRDDRAEGNPVPRGRVFGRGLGGRRRARSGVLKHWEVTSRGHRVRHRVE